VLGEYICPSLRDGQLYFPSTIFRPSETKNIIYEISTLVTLLTLQFIQIIASHIYIKINAKNFNGSLATVVRAQNDTSKIANITDTIFDSTLV